jgi:uncharacterized protein (DUF1778 family)
MSCKKAPYRSEHIALRIERELREAIEHAAARDRRPMAQLKPPTMQHLR